VRCVDCAKPVRAADAEVAGHLYRIAQEAAEQRAENTRLPPRFGSLSECRDHALVLEVDDNGEGLDETASPADGIGLRVMRYRARLIEGDLGIGSPPAGGTRISCRVKLPA
jgi:nitrate/nitrite-specific signal transduction histidine kinase